MSVLLRTLAWLGSANLDGQPGPGWIRVEERSDRQFAVLTPAGVDAHAQRGVERDDGRVEGGCGGAHAEMSTVQRDMRGRSGLYVW